MNRHRLPWLIVVAAGLAVGPLCAAAQTVPSSLYSAMVWRNIGPFRGGRVAAVTGAIGQPGVFYMGLPAGGVWKTTSAGTTWYPVFDSVTAVSSVGAIEAAPSDPNVVYAGTGDMFTGGAVNLGNGVYKSTDAGATWRHLGLDGTAHIPSILVDPTNPDIVLAAAMGPRDAASDARGLYRSTDGGITWKKTLYVDDETGVQKIAWAYDRPNVMLATTVRSYFRPGQFGPRPAGPGARRPAGPTARLYESTDEGVTWQEITGGGLPELAGRTCVAIAMHTDAQRMYLVGNFGLYRSDDGGRSWRQMDATDRRVGNGQGGYNCGVYVNSQNPDIVYVVNTCLYRSTDGGTTFTGFKGAPGGDDPQQMWIDPTDGNRLFLGVDQGATVSLDGGRTWSSWYNQSTAQVYHISVDNRYPYWVYATQQDSGTVAVASRGNLGEISPLDWSPHPGAEFGFIVADPLNPRVTYGGGYGGLEKVTRPSEQSVNVSPNVDSSLGLRQFLHQPLLFSPTNPHELLAGFQCVMATTDGGMHWRKLSPDLTIKKGAKPATPAARPRRAPRRPAPAGSQSTEDEQFRGFGASIESMSASSLDSGVIWVGTSNGLIKVTRDHGSTWQDATIPNLPEGDRAEISAIDASHHDAGAAYVAVDCHNSGDYRPHLYRTRDYGKTWVSIVNGLPDNLASGSFARVIRADTIRPGLLFAGTESSVYVSFDDGDHWQPLRLNLPTTSYRDMVVKGNDLVVGTYGRGFWILDDVSLLRQVKASVASDPAHLFQPGEAIRVRRNVNGDTPFPPEVAYAENPPDGAIIYYYLYSRPAGDITLDVRDADGRLVRHLSSAPITAPAGPPPPVPDFWVQQPSPLPDAAGLNRTIWDLRYDTPPAFFHDYGINANPGETPPSPQGPLALPGVYSLTLTVNGTAYTQRVTVKNDPRSPASFADLVQAHELQMKMYALDKQSWECYQEVAGARTSIADILKAKPPEDVATAAHEFDGKLAAVGGGAGFGGMFAAFFRGGGPNAKPTFSLECSQAVQRMEQLDSGDMAPDAATRKACAATEAGLLTAVKTWTVLKSKDLLAFDALLAKNNLKPIAAPEAGTTTSR